MTILDFMTARPYLVPEDERVEDAALTDQDVQPGANAKQQLKISTRVYV